MRSQKLYTKQRRIAELARRRRDPVFTALNHYIDMDWMLETYRQTRKLGRGKI